MSDEKKRKPLWRYLFALIRYCLVFLLGIAVGVGISETNRKRQEAEKLNTAETSSETSSETHLEAIDESDETGEVGSRDAQELWRQDAITKLQAEEAILEASWVQDGSLWISMNDNGTKRDGLADYSCLLVRDAGKPEGYSIVITAIDHQAMLRQDLVELGKAVCE